MTIPEEFYEQILTNAPSSDTQLLILSRLKEEGRAKRVVQGCIKALDFAPDDLRIRRLLAESYLETGLLSQAEAELDKVLSSVHDLLSLYKLQAELYTKQNRNDEALRPIKLYLAHYPDDREAREIMQRIESSENATSGPPPVSEDMEETDGEGHGIEEEKLPDISTPTLAEIYYKQGQIQEALETYERVVAQNPNDDRSEKRLEELRAMLGPESPAQENEANEFKNKNRKMIAVLEGWIGEIRQISGGTTSH